MSTDDQEDSPATQGQLAGDFIRQNALPPWTRTYFDLGKSGGSMAKRRSFLTMIADAERSRPSCIVFYKLDRAFRNAEEQAVTLNRLKRIGIKILKVRDPNLDGPIGEMVDGILGHINQFERQLTGVRIRDHNLAMAQRGEWPGGPAPYGYLYRKPVKETRNRKPVTVQPGALEPHPEEWPRATQIWEWALSGYRKAEILEMVLARGWRRRNGNLWDFSSLNRFFASRVYAGYVPFGFNSPDPEIHGEWFLGKHVAMISLEDWQRIQGHAHRGNARQRAVRNPRAELAGLIRCRICGGVVASSSSTRDHGYAYTCIAAARHKNAIHPFWARREWMVHMAAQAVLDRILQQLPEVPPPDTTDSRRQAAEQEIARLQNQRRRLRELYKLGEYDDDMEQFQREARALDVQIAALQGQLTAAGPAKEELALRHRQLLDWHVAYEAAGTVAEKQRLWRDVIERIEVDGTAGLMWVTTPVLWPDVPTEWTANLPPPGVRQPGTNNGRGIVGDNSRPRGWFYWHGIKARPVGEPVVT